MPPRSAPFAPTTLMPAIGLVLASWLLVAEPAAAAAAWSDALKAEVERIDEGTPGQIGLYVKRLDNGETLSYQADRPWYLGSMVKLPIALAVLQEVADGKQSLDKTIRLQDSDKIDGSGAVVWQKSGTSYSLDALLKAMMMQSDNTAANLLIRAIGEDTLNQRARTYLGEDKGFKQITNFTEVRQAVYSQIHPNARQLPNTTLVQIAGARQGPARVQALQRSLSLKTEDLKLKTLDEAYAAYYQTGVNSASLVAYGGMLEKLVRGEVLPASMQQRLYRDMKFDSYDAYRLEAGLPKTVRFIHKTGTQFERACHAGVIEPQRGAQGAVVVVACAEGMDEHAVAGRAFEQLGQAITRTLLPGQRPGR